MEQCSLPVLDDGVDFGEVGCVGGRVERRKAALGVPRISTRRPRQLRRERVPEVVKRPRQNHDVVDVQREADHRRAVPNS